MEMIRKTAYSVKIKLLDSLCYASQRARSFDPKENILISSYPRSGSTWLAELIHTLPDTALLWEPLHLRNVREFRALGFGWRQYIPGNERWEEARKTFEQLFKGELLNYWLSSREFPLHFFRADRMIIKFVRANGMLPWLTNTFNFKKAPVYLLRHPFAVAASQMKEGSWNDEFTDYRVPEMPYNEVYSRHAPFLATLKTKPEAIVADWCINNKVVLDNPRNHTDWICLHYENLLQNPEQELKRVFDRWETPMPEGILGKVSEASSTARELTFQNDVEAQLSKWKTFFAEEEIRRMQRVLEYFEIEIYSEETLPQSIFK